MKHAQCMRDLLRPLGIYRLDAPFNGGELDVQGEELDKVMAWLEEVQRENSLTTAEDWGLENIARLFVRRPVADQPRKLAAALAALLRIGGDCFTLTDINNTISGCGIKAVAQEKEQFGYIRIVFPEVAGIPEGFEQIRDIILDIIPCHLDVEFYFRYLTWAECEAFGYTWAIIHEREYTWHGFELAV